jgi:hypothetical protein
MRLKSAMTSSGSRPPAVSPAADRARPGYGSEGPYARTWELARNLRGNPAGAQAGSASASCRYRAGGLVHAKTRGGDVDGWTAYGLQTGVSAAGPGNRLPVADLPRRCCQPAAASACPGAQAVLRAPGRGVHHPVKRPHSAGPPPLAVGLAAYWCYRCWLRAYSG